MKRFSRTLSWLLVIAMVVAMVPAVVSATSEAETINFNDFVKNASDRCTIDVTNEGSAVRLATTSQGNDTYTFQGTNATIDHSKDLVLTQTLNVANAAAGGDPKFGDYTAWLDSNSGNDVRNAVQFWMSDTAHASEGKAVVFSLGRLFNNADGKWNSIADNPPLRLRVHQNGSKTYTDVLLDKMQSETFELSIRWNTDDSVNIYVDGELKGTVENATVNTTTLFGDNTIGFHYTTNGAKASDVTISDMSLKAVDPSIVNFTNFVKNASDRCTIDITGMGETVRLATTSQGNDTYTFQGTNATIDHSKDLVWTQTLNVTDVASGGDPWFVDYTGWLDDNNSVRNAIQFWMSDAANATEGQAVVFSLGRLYNSNWNSYDGNVPLILRVHQNGSKVHTDIDLGLYLSTEFELTICWNTDDSVDVYVDGIHKGTVKNATVNTTTLFGDNTIGFHYTTNGAKASDVTVSDMSLTAQTPVEPVYKNFNDFTLTTQGTPVVTIENAGNTIRGAFTSGSTSEMIMTTTDTRVDHSKDMILTQYIDPTNLAIQGEPSFTDYNGWYDSANNMRNAYNFWLSDTADASEGAAVVFSLGCLWNSSMNKDGSKMLLRVHQNGTKVHTDINLKEYSTDPFELSVRWNSDDSVDIYVDGAYKATVENATINTTTLFGDDTVGIRYFTHNANGAPGELAISNMSLKAVDPSVMNFKDFALSTQGAPVVSVEDAGNTVKADLSGGSVKGMIMTATNTQIDHSKDMILTQNINPINLSANGNPVFGDYNTWNDTPNDVRNAYDFWIGETAHASEGAAVAFSVGALFNSSINKDGSKMILRVHQNGSKVFTDVILKDYDTTPFELSICWNTDDSVDIYVDGVFKGTVENATINTTSVFGDDTVGIHYYTNNGNGVKGQFAVSNMTLTAVEPEVPAEPVAAVDGVEYPSFEEAYAAAGAEDVIVLLDEIAVEDWTLSKNITIDLNGFAMEAAVAAVENNAVIYGKDSTTDNYDAEACGSLKVTGATVVGAEGYLALTDGEKQYSFHAYEVKLTHVSLDPNADALGYKAQVFGDSQVQSAVTGYGFIMQAAGGASKTCEKSGTPAGGVFTLRLHGILAAGGGKTQIGAEAFVIFSDVGEVKSGNHSTTMKETLETIASYVENDAATYTETQMTAIQNLIAKFESKMDGWDIDSIKNWTAA